MKGGRASKLYDQVKAAMTEDEKAEHDSEYQSLLALFISLLRSWHTESRQEALYLLMELRTDLTFNHVLKGMKLDYDRAIQLLKSGNDQNLTKEDKDYLDRVIAAIRNLIDFSVCEEYQLYDEVSEIIGEEEIDFNNVDDYEDYLLLCQKYNDRYAAIENADIAYAGAVAAFWMRLSANDYLVYWTQNDSKVRPWHMALQGYTAHPDEFPSWMIPPIEYNCRCFLQTLEVGPILGRMDSIKATARKVEKPSQLDDVYSESLAKCGRIFAPSHSYFSVKEKDKEMLKGFVSRLREKYYAA